MLAGGITYGLGPLIGSLFYSIGGFPLPFFVLGGCFMAVFPFVKYALPERVDEVIRKQESDVDVTYT